MFIKLNTNNNMGAVYSSSKICETSNNGMNFNLFDVNLFNKLCETCGKDGNVLFSPLSVSLALSVLLLGSEGRTKEQLAEALGFNEGDDVLEKLKPLMFSHNTQSVKLNVANSVCPSENFEINAVSKILKHKISFDQ